LQRRDGGLDPGGRDHELVEVARHAADLGVVGELGVDGQGDARDGVGLGVDKRDLGGLVGRAPPSHGHPPVRQRGDPAGVGQAVDQRGDLWGFAGGHQGELAGGV
jgi:hypothetical protein